jgi:hypothetical protein
VFGVDEQKFLGHIISKDGVKIDPERVEVIKRVPLPKPRNPSNISWVKIILLEDSTLTWSRQ